jgi:hypothetical protein
VAEVFDRYVSSGDVEIHTGGASHDVHGVRAKRRAPSQSHVWTWCRAHRATHLRRRPRLGRKSRLSRMPYLILHSSEDTANS